jgi:hypothetical protein
MVTLQAFTGTVQDWNDRADNYRWIGTPGTTLEVVHYREYTDQGVFFRLFRGNITWSNPYDGAAVDSDGDGIMDCTDPYVDDPTNNDSDGDGLDNDCDPFPDSASSFSWKVVLSQDNYTAVKFGSGEMQHFGTPNNNEPMTIHNDYWKGPDSWQSVFCAGGGSEVSDVVDDSGASTATESPGGEAPESMEGQEGVDGSGASTDSERLDNISENTRRAVDNLQRAIDYLKDINRQVGEGNKLVASGGSGTGAGNGDGTSADTIGDGVGQALDGQNAEGEAAGSAALSGVADPEYPGAYSGDEIPEETPLSDVFAEVDGDSRISDFRQYVESARIETSSNFCSFSWSYRGQSVVFTICPYAAVLQSMGNIMLVLSAISAVFILTGKG